jgi:hypothetical protein
MHHQLLQRYADEMPGWNVLLSNPDKETLRIRLAEGEQGSIYSEKAESYKAEGLTISINNREAESNSEHILFLFEPVGEEDFTLVVEVWNPETEQWQPYQGGLIKPDGQEAGSGPIILHSQTDSAGLDSTTVLDALAKSRSLFWYTHKPFTSSGVAGDAKLDEQDIEALRNLGYLQ